MASVTFVCDLCGTPGRAEAPGAAQCQTCGQVALVGASSAPATSPEPDPFLVAGSRRIGPEDPVDFVLEDEVTPEPPGRLASLWVPPGRDDGPTPEPGSMPPFRRVRTGRRALATVGALAAGGALALGAAVGVGFLAFGPDDGVEGDLASASVPPEAGSLVPPSPAPQLPAPARAAASARPVASAETRPTRATPPPLPGPPGETLRDLQMAAYRNPAPVDRQCVPRALRDRADVAGRLPEEIRARFPVAESGAVGPVEVIGDVPDPEVAAAIEEAIRGCPFVPGADEEGRPIPLSVVMRIRFAVQ